MFPYRHQISVVGLIALVFVLYVAVVQYDFSESEYGSVSLWNPPWAAEDGPDMLVFAVENAGNSPYATQYVHLFIQGRAWNDERNYDPRFDDSAHVVQCQGRFKKNLRTRLYNGLGNFFNATGLYFEADACLPQRLTAQESDMVHLAAGSLPR